MEITRKLYIDNTLPDLITEFHATGDGVLYCKDDASFSVTATNKYTYNFTGLYSESGNINIMPIR